MALKYFIIAGEASGDFHAGCLMEEMKKINSNVSFEGIGGPLMEERGLSSIVNIEKMAIMGFWEVIKEYRFLKSIELAVLKKIKNNNLDAVILVDYPGFNLRVAKKIKKINPSIPIFYYISPQIWAWKEGRLDIIKKYIDKMIVIFDFEKKWYQKRGVDVEFVGHPFLDIYNNPSRELAKKELGLEENKKYLTLFPGSRKQEIDYHLPYMLQALKNPFFKNFKVLIGQARTLPQEIESLYDLEGVKIVKDQPEKALAAADIAWVGSGTSTLESVLFNVPIILVYKTSSISWYLMKKFVKVQYAGIPNIIINKMIIPELLQNSFTPRNLIYETKQLLTDTKKRDALFKGYQNIKIKLGKRGAAKKAAQLILNN